MKMFETVSSTMGSQRDEVKSMPEKMKPPASRVKREHLFRRRHRLQKSNL
jgi:hypothetical protein